MSNSSGDNNRIRIYRAKHDNENPYFLMRRDTAQDERISLEARGMLAYLLSKPADWILIIADLMRAGDCGRDRVHRILRELLTHHYAKRTAQRDANGKYLSVDYEIFESPQTEKPYTGFPYTDNPHLQSIDVDKVQTEKKRASPEQIGNVRDEHQSLQGNDTSSKPDTSSTSQPIGEKKKDTPPPKPRQRDPEFDAIAELFELTNGGIISNIQGMLFGSKKVRGEWNDYRPTPPMTLDELRAFAAWDKQKMRAITGSDRMPQKAETIARHLEEYRRSVPQTTQATSRYVLADEQDAPQTSAPMWE